MATKPSSVSKINCPPPKPLPAFATVPVGQPGLQLPFGFFVAPGMVTTSAVSLLPLLSYSVEVPLLLSEIQKSCPGRKEIPQGFKSCGSVVVAAPAVFDTRLVCIKPVCWACTLDEIPKVTVTAKSKSIFLNPILLTHFDLKVHFIHKRVRCSHRYSPGNRGVKSLFCF